MSEVRVKTHRKQAAKQGAGASDGIGYLLPTTKVLFASSGDEEFEPYLINTEYLGSGWPL